MAAPQKQEWIAILPDKMGILPERMKVRPQHLEGLKVGIESGFWKFGGVFMNPEQPVTEGGGPNIMGSIVLAEASSREELLEVLKKDAYTENGIWDWDKVQIYPFRSAVRVAL